MKQITIQFQNYTKTKSVFNDDSSWRTHLIGLCRYSSSDAIGR